MPNTPTQQTSPSEASSNRNQEESQSTGGNGAWIGHKLDNRGNDVICVAIPSWKRTQGTQSALVTVDEWTASRFAVPVTTGASERV